MPEDLIELEMNGVEARAEIIDEGVKTEYIDGVEPSTDVLYEKIACRDF